MQIIILMITLCCVLFAYYFGTLINIITNKTKRIPVLMFGVRYVDVVGDGETPRDSDEIYPVHFIDQAAIVRSSLISYTFRYEHVLNARKLHESLVMLLTQRDWRKLGGRLRQNRVGQLEIHVPRNFSRDRPPIHFSHVEFSVDMDTHPLASRLPKKTGSKPSIHEGCYVFRDFSIPSTLPNHVNHYLSTDEPLICLHINSFTDGTLVSVTFPHVLSDAMGTAEFLQAWAHIVNNRNPEHLEMKLEGSTEDVVASVGATNDKIAQSTRFVLEDRQITGLSLLVFVARYTFDILTRRNIEARHIYLPVSFLTHLRRQAEKEFRLDNEDKTRSIPFVSDGDLITAWGSRMVLSSAPAKGAAAICNVFDMRRRLDLLSPSPAARASTYLQNLILPSTTLLTAEETRSLSVSQIALRVRKAIIEQTSDAQVRSLMRIARTWFASLGSMPLFGGWNTTSIIACTNWTKARFLIRADFGSAAVADSGKGCVRQLRPVAYWGTTLAVSDNPRDTFVIYGKDADGDYWVHAYLRKETWHLIESEMDQFTGN